MKIAAKVYMIVGFLLLALLVLCLILLFSQRQAYETMRQDRRLDQIVSGVFELNILTYDNLRSHSERTAAQWRAQYASLAELIRTWEA